MLTIEGEIFRGVNAPKYFKSAPTQPLSEHLSYMWDGLDEFRAAGNWEYFYRYHAEVSSFLLEYWKHKIDLAREHPTNDGLTGSEKLSLYEQPFQGVEDGVDLVVSTELDSERHKFAIREINSFGTPKYDHLYPIKLFSYVQVEDETETEYEVTFNRNTFVAEDPFLIQKFTRLIRHPSFEESIGVEYGGALTFRLNHLR